MQHFMTFPKALMKYQIINLKVKDHQKYKQDTKGYRKLVNHYIDHHRI